MNKEIKSMSLDEKRNYIIDFIYKNYKNIPQLCHMQDEWIEYAEKPEIGKFKYSGNTYIKDIDSFAEVFANKGIDEHNCGFCVHKWKEDKYLTTLFLELTDDGSFKGYIYNPKRVYESERKQKILITKKGKVKYLDYIDPKKDLDSGLISDDEKWDLIKGCKDDDERINLLLQCVEDEWKLSIIREMESDDKKLVGASQIMNQLYYFDEATCEIQDNDKIIQAYRNREFLDEAGKEEYERLQEYFYGEQKGITLYRYMSLEELKKIMSGEKMEKHNRYDRMVKEGSRGFCFLPKEVVLQSRKYRGEINYRRLCRYILLFYS